VTRSLLKRSTPAGRLGRLSECEFAVLQEDAGRGGSDRDPHRTKGRRAHAAFEAAAAAHHNAGHRHRSRGDRDPRCFIASTVYGTHAHQTDELRAFRDRILAPSWTGRCLVRAYYAVSPTVAAWLVRSPRVLPAVRWTLDRLRHALPRAWRGRQASEERDVLP
jgi:hypothetical protein